MAYPKTMNKVTDNLIGVPRFTGIVESKRGTPVFGGLLVTISFSTNCVAFFYKVYGLYSNTFNIGDKSINTCEKLFYRLIRRRTTFVQVLTNNLLRCRLWILSLSAGLKGNRVKITG